jgi:hypothetical protein
MPEKKLKLFSVFPHRMIQDKMVLMTDNTRLNMMAQPRFLILSPGSRASMSISRSASMISINKPSVSIVTGMVRIMSRGLKVAFTIASKIAATMALQKFLISTPLNKYADRKTARAFTRIFIIISSI